MATGVLVLVVGPSGAGKDTLIAAARGGLAADPDFVFPRRAVTRTAIAAVEDHDSVSPEDFAAKERDGGYVLSWRAHGLGYGLPASIADDLAAGRTVVVNGSRAVAAAAAEKFPNLRVLLVEASPQVRGERLAARGRESGAEIAARLAREVEVNVPGAIRIDNSGAVEDGVARFVEALRAMGSG